MSRTKKLSVALNSLLLIWFFLDMIGVYWGNHILVTRSWKDDGIFFIIFAIALLWFILKEKLGKLKEMIFHDLNRGDGRNAE